MRRGRGRLGRRTRRLGVGDGASVVESTVDAAVGAWEERDYDGEEFVDAIRHGNDERAATDEGTARSR